jgi:membrane complex biogenesis BtpA family protein
LIEGNAEAVQTLIRRLDADVQVWADVDVKHATQLAPRPLGDLAVDALDRGLASAVIVTGRATGSSASRADLIDVRSAIGKHPLYVGSGVTVDTIASMIEVADGVIVGTAAKVDGLVANPVDSPRVRALVQALENSRIG